MGAGHSANRPQAGFEVLDVEKEDCTNSGLCSYSTFFLASFKFHAPEYDLALHTDATDATYFKHRDLMVFPKEGTDKHARPIYRRELLE
jgi:hypothetical protein